MLLAMVPLLGLDFLFEETAEWTFVGLSTSLGFVSLVPAYIRRHRKCRPLAFFSAGLLLLLAARMWFEAQVDIEVLVGAGGALLISGAHFINRRLCRACLRCDDHCG
jgi:hypothetical protein